MSGSVKSYSYYYDMNVFLDSQMQDSSTMISSLWMEATPATRFSTDSSKYAKKRLDPLPSIAKVGLCSQTIFVPVILVFHFIFFRPICFLCTSRALLLDGYVILLFDIQAVLAGVLTPECKLKCDESSFSTENIRIFSVCAPPPPPPPPPATLWSPPPPLPGTLCPSPVCYAPQVRYAPPPLQSTSLHSKSSCKNMERSSGGCK